MGLAVAHRGRLFVLVATTLLAVVVAGLISLAGSLAAANDGLPPTRGYAARGSDMPTVTAYAGPLPEGYAGVEFYASAPPMPIGSGPAPQVRWYPGDRSVFPVDDETVGICVRIMNPCFKGGS